MLKPQVPVKLLQSALIVNWRRPVPAVLVHCPVSTLPACVAVREQAPVAMYVTVEPLTVQRLVLFEENVTGRPEDAVAVRVAEPPTAPVAGALKVTVWVRFPTVIVSDTWAAAFQSVSPA